jgi:hypothetical protein
MTRTPITMSLNEAQRFLQTLREYRDGVRFTGTIDLHTSKPDVDRLGPNRVAEILQERVRTQVDQQRESVEVKEDVVLLKEALFAANVTSGVSRLMAHLQLLKASLERNEGYRKQVQANDSVVRFDQLGDGRLIQERALALDVTVPTMRALALQVSVAPFSLTQLSDTITSLRKQIRETEREITRKNSATSFQFEFSQASINILGL